MIGENVLFLSKFNTKVRINYSVDCISVVWHALNHIGQVLLAHAVWDILSAVITYWFRGYFMCACGVFGHIPVSGCDNKASPLFGDTRGHSKRQLSW